MSEYDAPNEEDLGPVLGDAPAAPPTDPGAPAAEGPASPGGGDGDRETQWSIARRQFRKNRGAVWGLRVSIALVLVAVFAPALASAQPFFYKAPDSGWSFPWFTTLFDTRVWEHALDRIFNIGMVAMTLYFLGRLAFRLIGKRIAGWGRLVALLGIAFGLAHLMFDFGAPTTPAKDYRVSIDALKAAEDTVAAAPIADRVKASVAGMRNDFGALYTLLDDAVRELSTQGSREASNVTRSLGDALQSLSAEQGRAEFTLQRLARRAGLLAKEDTEQGVDAPPVDPKLQAAWGAVMAQRAAAAQAEPPRPNPQAVVKTLRDSLSVIGGPIAETMRFEVSVLSDEIDRVVSETADRLGSQIERAGIPDASEAKELLAKAQAVRDEYTIVYPPVPYGYREQLPQGYDRFRGYADFERGERHALGTDETGRDVFARILFGTRISLTIGLFAVGIYVTIGMIFGALAGYFGGWVDMAIMRVVEILICVPGLFLILTIVALFGERSIWLLMFAIGVVSWTGITRLVRGEFLRERNSEYVLAAQAMGYSTPRIIFRHVLPNALGPVLVAATFGIAGAILTESGLSFIGLGDVSVPSWGGILDAGRTNEQWHMIIPPSIAIFITVTALNLVGDGVRDALDPKLRD